jgi:predicted nucleotidyltransferase
MEYSRYMVIKQMESNKNIINIDLFLNKIIQKLQIVKPSKIILFGSYAKGDYDEESDIDLVVILNTEMVPATYDKKLEIKVHVRDSIYELSRQMAIDLVVYTKGEFKLLKDLQTSFYNEIINTGKVIYEKTG